MLAEQETRNEIISEWVLKPAKQESEELASQSHETKRIPDPYIFRVKNGKLVSPANNIPVENKIEKGGPIYDGEYEAFIKLQSWADKNVNQVSLWFSPPYLNGYFALKIVASEILYSDEWGKILFNRAFVLDVDSTTSLKIANYLSKDKFTNPEELRSQPIFLDNGTDWESLLSQYTDQIDLIKNSEDLKIKNRTLNQVRRIYTKINLTGDMNIFEAREFAYNQARLQGLIGKHADSCATSRSTFNSIFGNLFETVLDSFPCPRCNGPITSGLGITTCPHCGLTKEQAGSTCG